MKIVIRDADGTTITLDTGNQTVTLEALVRASLDVWYQAFEPRGPKSAAPNVIVSDNDATTILPTYHP